MDKTGTKHVKSHLKKLVRKKLLEATELYKKNGEREDDTTEETTDKENT